MSFKILLALLTTFLFVAEIRENDTEFGLGAFVLAEAETWRLGTIDVMSHDYCERT